MEIALYITEKIVVANIYFKRKWGKFTIKGEKDALS